MQLMELVGCTQWGLEATAGCFDRLIFKGYCHESLVKLLLLFDRFQDNQDTKFAEPVANQNWIRHGYLQSHAVDDKSWFIHGRFILTHLNRWRQNFHCTRVRVHARTLKSVKAAKPQSRKAAKLQSRHGTRKPQSRKAAKPQSRKAAKPQSRHGTRKPQSRKALEGDGLAYGKRSATKGWLCLEGDGLAYCETIRSELRRTMADVMATPKRLKSSIRLNEWQFSFLFGWKILSTTSPPVW